MNDPGFLAALDRAAERALSELGTGRRVGLGTGRAAEAFIRRFARDERARSCQCVPTSERSAALGRELGLCLVSLAELSDLDVAFDGADEVEPTLGLTKGLGGAMLRERVVAAEARRFVVLVTPEKLVKRLGERAPLPVEVVPFAVPTAQRRFARLSPRVERRSTQSGEPFITDNGNAVFDLFAPDGGWANARALDAAVRATPGVVDTGFFFGMSSMVIVADADEARALTPPA